MLRALKRLAQVLGCILLAETSISGQPRIARDGVLNHASYAPFGLHNGSIAQGSIFAVFGEDLGPDVSTPIKVENFPLGTALAGTSIQVTVNGTSVDALPLYVSPRQLGALLPSSTPTGTGTLTVTFEGHASAAAPITVVKRNFGIFTKNKMGSGPAVLQHADSPPEQSLNSILNSAKPGQLVTLYGTGLGPVSGDEDKVSLPGDLGIQVTLYVGRQTVEVLYAGRAGPECCAGVEPGSFGIPAGLDQVVFRIPDGIEGCYVPVGVIAGTDRFYTDRIHNEGVLGNHATLSISSSGGICNDPTGLSGTELEALQKSGNSHIGVVSLSRSFYLDDSLTTREVGAADFRRYDTKSLLASRGIFGLPAAGTCLWLPELPPEVLPTDPIQPAKTDAGPVLTLTGPNGIRQLVRAESGQYRAVLADHSPRDQPGYLVPGFYTLDNGDGGSDVGPFRTDFAVPRPVIWTNRAVYLREPPLDFRWSGGEPDAYVVISMLFMNDFASEQILCVSENSAGVFFVPSILVKGISGTMVGGSFGPQPYVLGIGSLSKPGRLSAPTLDTGLVISVILTDAVYHN